VFYYIYILHDMILFIIIEYIAIYSSGIVYTALDVIQLHTADTLV